MAWSGAALSSDELAWAADDKPILGSNAAMGALSASRWVAGAAGDFTDPDISDSDYPVSRLFEDSSLWYFPRGFVNSSDALWDGCDGLNRPLVGNHFVLDLFGPKTFSREFLD